MCRDISGIRYEYLPGVRCSKRELSRYSTLGAAKAACIRNSRNCGCSDRPGCNIYVCRTARERRRPSRRSSIGTCVWYQSKYQQLKMS